MKSLLIVLWTAVILFSAPKPVPSAPPILPGMSSSAKKLPKSCEDIPPMLIKLPPPLEVGLQSCKNELKKPTIAKAKKLFGKGVVSVNIAKGFYRLYIIKLKKDKKLIDIYCNQNLSLCFETKPKHYNFVAKKSKK